ncbi:hypothetical protein BH09VER1_BH09VER1_43470 [soil metagenome]
MEISLPQTSAMSAVSIHRDLARPVKASPARYFFAKSWPWIVLFWGVPLLVVGAFADEAYLHHENILIESIFGSGFGLALVFGVIGPFKKRCGRKNGAPFCVGDKVTVLLGARKDQSGTVHQIWTSTRHVRVRFAGQKDDSEDSVFTYLEVMATNR